MTSIIQHLPEILTGLTGLIATLFFKQKADKKAEALKQVENEGNFVKKQQDEIYAVYDQMIELKQVQIELINNFNLMEQRYKKEVEKNKELEQKLLSHGKQN